MDKILWIELKRFIKRNYKKILVFSFITGLAYTLLSMTILRPDESGNMEESSEVSEDFANHFTGFQIYIEYDDGRPFTNTTLLEEYIIKEDVVSDAEMSTGTTILNRMEELEEAGFEKSGHNRGVLGVIRGNYSDIFTILVNVGSNAENMNVAEFYFEQLTEGDVNFLNDKRVYAWTEPELLLDYETGLVDNNPISNDLEGNSSFSNYVMDLVIGFIFGSVVSSLLLLLYSTLRNKDLYSFSYNRKNEDIFLLHDPSLNNAEEIAQIIMYPLSKNKVIVHDEPISKRLKSALDAKSSFLIDSIQVNYISKIADVTAIKENSEIIILLNSNNDSKQWYQEQRKIADIYNFPVKVVQINS